jgi:hypothetical protein
MTIKQFFTSSALCLLAAAVPASAQTYTFDPTGSVETTPYSINTSGAITGYYLDASNVYHGFVRAANGAITTIDAPRAGTGLGQGTVAYSINTSGAITGLYEDASHFVHGFVRDSREKSLPSIRPAAAVQPMPTASTRAVR